MSLINALATFSPLFASVGTIMIVARVYMLRFSKLMAALSICVWCVCQLATGIALLLTLHGFKKEDNDPLLFYCTMALQLTILLTLSVLFVCRFFFAAAMLSIVNIILHMIVVGVVQMHATALATFLALVGFIWVVWTCTFSLSFALFTRRRALKPLSDAVMYRMRRDFVTDKLNKHKVDDTKNGKV